MAKAEWMPPIPKNRRIRMSISIKEAEILYLVLGKIIGDGSAGQPRAQTDKVYYALQPLLALEHGCAEFDVLAKVNAKVISDGNITLDPKHKE